MMYSGTMRITNQVFLEEYKNPKSPEFQALASQVVGQVRHCIIYIYIY